MSGIASLLAGLGVVAIGFGLLSVLMALIQPYTDPLWIFGNLLVGVVLIGSAVAMSFDSIREGLRSSGARRAGKYGTSAIASAVLGVAILGLVGYLSARHSTRFDVSEAGVHTLAPQTLQLLEGLEDDVVFQAFFTETEAPPIRNLLDRYDHASDHIDLRFIDPNSSPELVEEYALSTEELATGLIRLSVPSGESTTLSEFSEPQLTNAIRKLVMSTGKKVYFLSGHNERTISPEAGDDGAYAASPESFGRAAEALRNETYRVEPLLLATLGDVPEDASAVIVAGPTRPLLEAEIAALQRYVEGGGGLFVAIDPRAQTNFYDLLQGWGVRLGDDVIVDYELAVYGQATTPIAREFDGQHAITSQMREPTLFPMVRSVELDPAANGAYTVLAKTGTDSWAERDLDTWRRSGRAVYDEGDLEGPVPVAIAGEPRAASSADGSESTAGRIVVFGDSDFATNEFLDALGNRDLFVNSINWLAGDVEQISIRPTVSRASSFQMSQDQFRRIQYLSLFVLPEAIAIFGVVMWWNRRRAPGRTGASSG